MAAPFAENLLLIQFGGTGQYGNQIAGGPANGNATGQGARFDLDGERSAGFFWAMVVDCPGPEEQERKFPWVYLFRNRFDRDVCGVGRYRGGVGLTDCFVIHGTPELRSNSVGTGSRFTKNYGLFGGYSGAAQPRIIIRGSNAKELMAAGADDLPMSVRELANRRRISGDYAFGHPNSEGETVSDGDVVVLARGCGGGYGDVLERDATAVLGDIADGVTSPELAARLYGVVLTPGGTGWTPRPPRPAGPRSEPSESAWGGPTRTSWPTGHSVSRRPRPCATTGSSRCQSRWSTTGNTRWSRGMTADRRTDEPLSDICALGCLCDALWDGAEPMTRLSDTCALCCPCDANSGTSALRVRG